MGCAPDAVRAAIADLDRRALEAVGVLVPGLEVPTTSSHHAGRRPRHLPFGGAAKETLETALRVVTGLAEKRIEPDHMLYALTGRGKHDQAVQILDHLGIDRHMLGATLLDSSRRSA